MRTVALALSAAFCFVALAHSQEAHGGQSAQSIAAPQAATPSISIAANGNKPSFDCATAKSASARLICSDAELSKADADIGVAYRSALNDGKDEGDKKTIKSMQLAWIKARNGRCGLDSKKDAPVEELLFAKPCFLKEYKAQQLMLATAWTGASGGAAHGVEDSSLGDTKQRLSKEEINALSARILSTWRAPQGPGLDGHTVDVRIKLKPDGTLAAPVEVVRPKNSPPQFAVLADSLVKAVTEAQPYSMFKPESYNNWKDIIFTFDQRQASASPVESPDKVAPDEQRIFDKISFDFKNLGPGGDSTVPLLTASPRVLAVVKPDRDLLRELGPIFRDNAKIGRMLNAIRNVIARKFSADGRSMPASVIITFGDPPNADLTYFTVFSTEPNGNWTITRDNITQQVKAYYAGQEQQERDRQQAAQQRPHEIAQAKIDAQSGDPIVGDWRCQDMKLRITKNGNLYLVHIDHLQFPDSMAAGDFAGPYKDDQILISNVAGPISVLQDKTQLLFFTRIFTKIGQ